MERVEEKPVEAVATPTNYDAVYIERALASAYKSKKLEVRSFHSAAISQSGENFCSVIYRIKVEFRKSENAPWEFGNFVLKDLLPIVAEFGSNEQVMYEQILPAMADILDKAPSSVGDRKLSAKCLFTERAVAKEVYLLEDLGALGYGSFDRQNGLSLEDARICVHKMAQFHAASMVLLHEQPSMVSQLAPSHYANGLTDVIAKVILLDGTAFGADVVSNFPGMAPIAEKMRAQLPEVYSERLRAVVDPKNCAFNVIVHGDLWVNNMMINSEKKVATIVDFQNCFVGSPAIDLLFFFYTSLQLDVLLHQQDNLLQDYYKSLCHTLIACNYPESMPSMAQLLDEVQRCLFYGYYAVVCEMPICCVSKEASEDFTVHTFGDTEAILAKRQQLFANERVRQTLEVTLGHFEKEGILNML